MVLCGDLSFPGLVELLVWFLCVWSWQTFLVGFCCGVWHYMYFVKGLLFLVLGCCGLLLVGFGSGGFLMRSLSGFGDVLRCGLAGCACGLVDFVFVMVGGLATLGLVF